MHCVAECWSHDDPFFISALYQGDQAQYEQKLRGAIREELHTLWQEEQALIGLFDVDRLVGIACIVTQQVPLEKLDIGTGA